MQLQTFRMIHTCSERSGSSDFIILSQNGEASLKEKTNYASKLAETIEQSDVLLIHIQVKTNYSTIKRSRMAGNY